MGHPALPSSQAQPVRRYSSECGSRRLYTDGLCALGELLMQAGDTEADLAGARPTAGRLDRRTAGPQG